MLLSSVSGGLISRQASTGHLAEEKASKKLSQKSARSKRCKSLLMLSSPFSSSTTSSMKSSLMSLLHPNQGHQQQQRQPSPELDLITAPRARRFQQRLSSTSSAAVDDRDEATTTTGAPSQNSPTSPMPTPSGQTQFSNSSSGSPYSAANDATNGGGFANDTTATAKTPPGRSTKCVKMKLFEQPLDKLFSPKAMKQLNNAINSNSPSTNSPAQALGKRKRSSSQQLAAGTTNACLRKLFSVDSGSADPNNNNAATTNNSTFTPAASQVRQLLLAAIPEPIRNLLIELYLRGPSTVGIFRKSPNAKHCKELRQKLETDSQSSIQQFQVTVIASVFKEWLRSLPDCLLMSRLYPQWIDVAKLIEPLYHQQSVQHHQSQSLDDSLFCNGNSDNTMMSTSISSSGITSLRPSRSPLTDNGQLQLDRARSCSTMMVSESPINKMRCDDSPSFCSSPGSTTATTPTTPNSVATTANSTTPATSMSAFALSERRSECLRIVRQLLDALIETNLILLRSFISVLWHIAQNSDENKMSANNLGVCVGQSLLNDEHQSAAGGKSGSSTFSKRHRRTRSQCLLSSTLSLTGSTSLLNNAGYYLDSNGAQETAKYVPMLVAFIIDNAPELFGQDIESMFSSSWSSYTGNVNRHKLDMKSASVDCNMLSTPRTTATDEPAASTAVSSIGKNQLQAPGRSFDQVDSADTTDHHRVDCTDMSPIVNNRLTDNDVGPSPDMGNHLHHLDACPGEPSAKWRQIVVENSRFQSSKQPQQQAHERDMIGLDVRCNISDGHSMSSSNHSPRVDNEDDSSTTTSILIVNSTTSKRHHTNHLMSPSCATQTHQEHSQQHRPLSATESTSSSRASSSTSGVHSESNAFSSSSEASDSHNTQGGTTASSPSPSPSTVSSPSSASLSSSPTQDEQRKHLLSCNDLSTSASGESSIEHQPTTMPDKQPQHQSRLNGVETANRQADVVPAPVRYQNAHLASRYSTFTGILNRIPKIPVQFTTSCYGGEAVIYNPRPRQSKSMERFDTSIDDSLPGKESVISMQPTQCSDTTCTAQQQQQKVIQSPDRHLQQPSALGATSNQHELRLHRLNEFLVHRNDPHLQQQQQPQLPHDYHQPLVSAPPSLAYHLSQSGYVQQHPASIAPRLQQQQPIAVYPTSTEQQSIGGHQQHPIFYSTTNLSSIQQLQQREHYLLYHRASLNPPRSHVMSLRDYYLSLQHQNQQRQQQQQITYRNRLHQQQQRQQLSSDTINKFHSSSQQQQQQLVVQRQQQQQQHQHGQYLVGYQQPLRSLQAQATANSIGAQLTTHPAIQTRPQTRLAKLRQNKFNGIYVNNNTGSNDHSIIVPKQVVGSNVAQKVMVKPMSSTSSDHSSDDSDESMNEAWMESTMV